MVSMLIVSSVSIGQTVNDVNIKDIGVKYCQLSAVQKVLSPKVIIGIDYGQERKMFEPVVVKDKQGKNMKFSSVIDALNFMNKYGWELHSTMLLTIGNTSVYTYVLKNVN